MSLAQCMGGWCQQRDKCAHHFAPRKPGRAPAERLCGDCEQPVLWKAQIARVDRLRERGAQMLANKNLDPVSRPFAEHWASQPKVATA